MSNDTVADEVPAKPRSYWYVVHTYSGYEAKVKVSMDERKRNEITRKEAEIEILKAKDTLSSRDEYALQEAEVAVEQLKSFFEVLVPAEKVVELVKGQRRTSTRKFFPGYVLVHVGDLGDFLKGFIRATPRVTGFVGGTDDPPAISEAEVLEITQQMEEGSAKPKDLFAIGDKVKVIDGPFQDFNGEVEEVKPEKGKLKVLISIFGRSTPVELEYVQVEKG
ncbi:MAG: transcription termination/antitermination protein NusG [Candidatus Binatia bacterium]|jgi:transcriptional antiterminator NusG|nr:transcription termination/antitermination protein NusG [Candidatus Binatia bacterium]MDG2011223.1 transcription termination/antitermination protein NusG [Candidatus Binatia bacterium]HAC81881.1 transcription termination/antitermination factor NusG [Deltaproteobacteria bacterium]